MKKAVKHKQVALSTYFWLITKFDKPSGFVELLGLVLKVAVGSEATQKG
jgi:hypothetical protein